ncbi:hypothetical protein HC928_06565 [bacterium]|nr:hypothetical protein [bacterium]
MEPVSTAVFSEYVGPLGFPFGIPHEVQQLAKEFVLANRSPSEPPHFPDNLVSFVLLNSQLGADPEEIWQSFTEQLNALGYWNALSNWINDIHQKEIINERDNPFGYGGWLFILLKRWAMRTDIPVMDLPNEVLLRLQILVLRAAVEHESRDQKINYLKRLKNINEWDHFMIHKLHIGTWLSLRLSEQISFRLWQQLTDLLNDAEWLVFEAWGLDQLHRNGFGRQVKLTRLLRFPDAGRQ